MKAVVFREFGDRDVLRYEEMEPPSLGPGDVLLRVKATSLNYYDIMARRGEYKPFETFPHILGGDVAGEVEALGEGVDGLSPGQPVLLFATINCEECEFCHRGETNVCIRRKYYGAHVWGGYAQYMRAKAKHLLLLPPAISFQEAAAFGMTFLTAWHMLVTRARIRPGEDVLILSAGAGIAVAAIQIAKLSGCRVLATSSSEAKCRRAVELGADVAINYRERDFCQEVRRITHRRGVDVVFEHTGSATWDQSVRSLARMGRLVTCGGTTGYEVTTNVAHLFQKQLTLIGSNYGTRPEMETLIQLLAERKFRVAIDQVLPLKEAREAHRLVEERENFGKVVLVPEEG